MRKPQYTNHCTHSDKEFYGQITIGEVEYDLYFFYNRQFSRWSYCLRFGNNLEDYEGGPLYDILFTAKPDETRIRRIMRSFIIFMDNRGIIYVKDQEAQAQELSRPISPASPV